MGSLWKGWSRRRAEELLMDVLSKLRPKFEIMMRWYSNLANQACNRKKQATTQSGNGCKNTENAHRADIANKVRSDTRTATCAGMRAQPHRAMTQHQEAVMCVWRSEPGTIQEAVGSIS